MLNYAKKRPFYANENHLFCLSNGQNRRFNLWKCAVSWCVWEGPECILSVFKQFDEGLDDFWTFVDYFWPVFDPFRAIFGHIGGYIGPFLDHFESKMGQKWVIFWVTLDRFWGDPVSLWGHLGIVLKSFYIFLGPFWYAFGHFGAVFGAFF